MCTNWVWWELASGAGHLAITASNVVPTQQPCRDIVPKLQQAEQMPPVNCRDFNWKGQRSEVRWSTTKKRQWINTLSCMCVTVVGNENSCEYLCVCVHWEQCVGPDGALSEAGFVHHVQVHLIIWYWCWERLPGMEHKQTHTSTVTHTHMKGHHYSLPNFYTWPTLLYLASLSYLKLF